jgi:hypothetical protein
MQSVLKEYTVDKTKIGFIRFIFEAYEGLAVVTTLEPGPAGRGKYGHASIEKGLLF